MKKQRLTKKLRIVTLWLVSVFWLTACQSDEETQHDRWDVSVKHALETLINEEGGKGAYAVFDFDKTTSVNDVSQALWVYQIEHLRFADAPKHLFLDGITEPDVVLDGLGLTSTQMGTVLKEEYDQLQALREAGWSLDEIHATDVYLDFRTRMYSFLEGLADSFPSEVHLAWMPGLLTGYTLDEARAGGGRLQRRRANAYSLQRHPHQPDYRREACG